MTAASTQRLVEIAIEARQASGAAVGRVVATDETPANLRDRRVLLGPLDPCGECEVCRAGGAAVCPTGRAREPGAVIRAAERWLIALDDALAVPLAGPAAAAIAGDLTAAYTMYARTGLAPRDPVVIVGDTAIARVLIQIVRAKGITPTVVARDRSFRAWLSALGVAVVDAGGDGDADGDVKRAVTAAIAVHGVGARPWRVLATDDALLAASLAGARATLTVFDRQAPALPSELVAREVTVVGVAGPHPDLVIETAALCAKGDLDLAGSTTTDPADRTRALYELVA